MSFRNQIFGSHHFIPYLQTTKFLMSSFLNDILDTGLDKEFHQHVKQKNCKHETLLLFIPIS
jgi:hypothetical protein